MERLSLVEYLKHFQQQSEECAYVNRHGFRVERWSYGQVAAGASQFARELEERSIVKGDRVLIWGQNCAQWAAAFFGCALRGAVVVPMDDVATPDFAMRVCRQVDAKLLVVSRNHLAECGSLPQLVLEDLPAVLSRHQASYPPVDLQRSDPLQIVFTSGTTAEPKGVVITHGNVLANVEPLEEEIRKYLKYERLVHPVRFLNLLPLSHVFGQFLGLSLIHI